MLSIYYRKYMLNYATMLEGLWPRLESRAVRQRESAIFLASLQPAASNRPKAATAGEHGWRLRDLGCVTPFWLLQSGRLRTTVGEFNFVSHGGQENERSLSEP